MTEHGDRTRNPGTRPDREEPVTFALRDDARPTELHQLGLHPHIFEKFDTVVGKDTEK